VTHTRYQVAKIHIVCVLFIGMILNNVLVLVLARVQLDQHAVALPSLH